VASGTLVLPETSIAGVRQAVAELDPDGVVVSSYDRILPADLVGSRPFVNVHYAPLPGYRGRAVVNWAIINGESHAAISVHSLEPVLDAGGILVQRQVEIGARDTITDLYTRLNAIQQEVLAEAVARRLDGDRGIEQNEAYATYACTRRPADGEIDWTAATVVIDRLVRALTPPFPGAFTWLGMDRIVICSAEPRDAPTYVGRIPGRVAFVDRVSGSVDILTGDGVLRVHTVHRDDGSEVAAASVFTSVRQTAGISISTVMAAIRSGRLVQSEGGDRPVTDRG
jgi:methionyl-tRNA formyltransferase